MAQNIKCGRCKAKVEFFTDDQGQDRGKCSICENGDTVDNIRRIVMEFVKERSAHQLHDGLRSATKGSKFIKLTSNRPPKRNHRFVVDM